MYRPAPTSNFNGYAAAQGLLDVRHLGSVYWSDPLPEASPRMTRDPHTTTTTSLFTQVQVSPTGQALPELSERAERHEQTQLLRDILTSQDRQNELLEGLINLLATPHRQRASELHNWKQANPRLANNCRSAAETLGKIQAEFVEKLTDEVNENAEDLMDGEFMLMEFVDRFGPRLAHLNSVLQMLAHLSSNPRDETEPAT